MSSINHSSGEVCDSDWQRYLDMVTLFPESLPKRSADSGQEEREERKVEMRDSDTPLFPDVFF